MDTLTVTFRGTTGEEKAVTEAQIKEFTDGFRGPVLQPGDEGYDEVRKVWNGLIDRRPALIARCTGVADVIQAVNLARGHSLLTAVRGGAHSFPGHSVCEGGLVIDLSPMKGVRVDPKNRRARANAGVTWGEFDHETQAFGLVTPGGVVSTTGIAGLTLGGGNQSWLSRQYGLTADNLVSADVVTADGEFVTANATENEDLFWALRGGGGNFGVVTSFEYQLHSLGPIVLAGPAFFRGDRAMELARFYRDYVEGLPDALTTAFFLITAPPAPFLPEDLHGKPVVVIVGCYAGPVEEGEAVVAPIRALKPEVDMLGPMPFTMLQSLFDPFVPHGIFWYAKSDYFGELSDGLLEEIVRWAATAPSPETLLHLNHFGGAVSRLDGTPFNHRNAKFAYSIDGAWTDPTLTERGIQWTREYWEALRPYAARGAYVNFLGDEGQDRVKEAYGPHYERLVAIKTKYDPQNLFRMNQNIPPNP